MSGVEVRIVGHAREFFDNASYSFSYLAERTIKDLFLELSRHAGPDFSRAIYDVKSDRINEHIAVFVNSKEIRALKGLDTRLHEGDVVTILPPMAGG